MQGAVISLTRLAFRLAVGLGVALMLSLLVALARGEGSFLSSLRLAVVAVGGFTLLLAGAGNSPSRRTAIDAEYSSWVYHKLGFKRAERQPKPYTGTVLGDSAIFVLVGIVLMTVGLLIPV
jgi:hypothetical protein